MHILTQDGLSADEEAVSLVRVEDVPGKAQRCFSVLDTGVKVHLMASGQLLASRCGLHTRPITELLFFRPLCLLITAAKDGASKYKDEETERGVVTQHYVLFRINMSPELT